MIMATIKSIRRMEQVPISLEQEMRLMNNWAES